MNSKELINKPPEELGKNFWAYYRVSTFNQDLQSQIELIHRFCEENGLNLVREFIDDGKTGTSTKERDEFERMIYIASTDHTLVDGIVYVHSARFGRNQLDTRWGKSTLRRKGIKLVAIQTLVPEDIDGPIKYILESLEEFVDEIFIKNLKDNINRGKEFRLKNGCVPVGKPKRGYKFIKQPLRSYSKSGEIMKGNKPVIDEALAPLIIRAFQLRARGATLEVLSKETGLYSGNNGHWYNLLRDKTYYGLYTFGGEEYDNVYPAIISEDLFNAVQKTLPPESDQPKNRRRNQPRRKGSPFFMGNIAFCGYCGSSLEGKSAGQRGYRSYICSKRNRNPDQCKHAPYTPADELHETILEALTQLVFQEDTIIDLIELTNAYLDSEVNEVRSHYLSVKTKLEDATSRLQKFIRNFGEMDVPLPETKELIYEQKELVEHLTEEHALLKEAAENSRIQVDMEKIIDYLNGVQRLIDGGEYWDLRELVEHICHRIVITTDACILYIKVPDVLL